ncbi:hypothetical protein ACJ73_09467 [Blastomyces percursus]|uniref:Uncharacterized protein n=1 Tax=Blastomyces percursus TaxID=1658174 RepID=A0A1J9Q791_9EURO|nr:hypothetical protein ACJ73_09467 [Blastomyces percursus]
MAETVSALLRRGTITHQALTRAQGLESLVGYEGDISRRKQNLPDDSSLAAWLMCDVDMIQSAPVQQGTESTKMDVHWKGTSASASWGLKLIRRERGDATV